MNCPRTYVLCGNSMPCISRGVPMRPSWKDTCSLFGLLTSMLAVVLKAVLRKGPIKETCRTNGHSELCIARFRKLGHFEEKKVIGLRPKGGKFQLPAYCLKLPKLARPFLASKLVTLDCAACLVKAVKLSCRHNQWRRH